MVAMDFVSMVFSSILFFYISIRNYFIQSEMKLHGFIPMVSFGNTRSPKDTYRAAIWPHQCVVEFLHPPLRRKTGVAPGPSFLSGFKTWLIPALTGGVFALRWNKPLLFIFCSTASSCMRPDGSKLYQYLLQRKKADLQRHTPARQDTFP